MADDRSHSDAAARRDHRTARWSLLVAAVAAVASPIASWVVVGHQLSANIDQSRFEVLYSERKALYSKTISDAEAYVAHIRAVDAKVQQEKPRSHPRIILVIRCTTDKPCPLSTASSGGTPAANDTAGPSSDPGQTRQTPERSREAQLLAAVAKDATNLSLIANDRMREAAKALHDRLQLTSNDVSCEFSSFLPCALSVSDADQRTEYFSKRSTNDDAAIETFTDEAHRDILSGSTS